MHKCDGNINNLPNASADDNTVRADLVASTSIHRVWMPYHRHPYAADRRMVFALEPVVAQILASTRPSVRRLNDGQTFHVFFVAANNRWHATHMCINRWNQEKENRVTFCGDRWFCDLQADTMFTIIPHRQQQEKRRVHSIVMPSFPANNWNIRGEWSFKVISRFSNSKCVWPGQNLQIIRLRNRCKAGHAVSYHSAHK